MSRIWTIARREWLEQRRQPVMLGVIAALFTAIAVLVVGALGLLDVVLADPRRLELISAWLPDGTTDNAAFLRSIAGAVVGISNFLIFTQFLGIVAVLAGHSVLHDKQCHTLPFLLLAPIRRGELLLGKVLGAMGMPFVLYLALSGGASLLAAQLPITADLHDTLPPSPSWMVAFLLGGPTWAAFVASLCAIVSTLSRDVRTAQQVVWFVMFFATFLCGYLLSMLLADGVMVQLAVAGVGGLCTASAIAVGATVISRDLSR